MYIKSFLYKILIKKNQYILTHWLYSFPFPRFDLITSNVFQSNYGGLVLVCFQTDIIYQCVPHNRRSDPSCDMLKNSRGLTKKGSGPQGCTNALHQFPRSLLLNQIPGVSFQIQNLWMRWEHARLLLVVCHARAVAVSKSEQDRPKIHLWNQGDKAHAPLVAQKHIIFRQWVRACFIEKWVAWSYSYLKIVVELGGP